MRQETLGGNCSRNRVMKEALFLTILSWKFACPRVFFLYDRLAPCVRRIALFNYLNTSKAISNTCNAIESEAQRHPSFFCTPHYAGSRTGTLWRLQQFDFRQLTKEMICIVLNINLSTHCYKVFLYDNLRFEVSAVEKTSPMQLRVKRRTARAPCNI